MKNFFHAHPDATIAILASVFLAIIIAFYGWAINDVFSEVHQAFTVSSAPTAGSFNLAGASKLDLRGLLPGTSSTPAATPVGTSTAQ